MRRAHRLLSIDIGSRNLAYCVAEAACAAETACGAGNCCGAGECFGTGECRGAGALRVAAWGVEDISSAGGGTGDLIPNAVALAARLVEEHGGFDQVALENQLGKFAARNKMVQSALHAAAILLCPGCDVINVSPVCKTTLARKLLGPGASEEVVASSAEGPGRSKKRSGALVQKRTVIMAAEAFLRGPGGGTGDRDAGGTGADWMLGVFSGSKKKDDLSDCLLQALHVLERGGFLRLEPVPGAGGGPTHAIVYVAKNMGTTLIGTTRAMSSSRVALSARMPSCL